MDNGMDHTGSNLQKRNNDDDQAFNDAQAATLAETKRRRKE
jgi:hypothetical protein